MIKKETLCQIFKKRHSQLNLGDLINRRQILRETTDYTKTLKIFQKAFRIYIKTNKVQSLRQRQQKYG